MNNPNLPENYREPEEYDDAVFEKACDMFDTLAPTDGQMVKAFRFLEQLHEDKTYGE